MVAKVTKRQLQAVGVLVKCGLASSGATAIVGNYSWECGSPNLPTVFRTSHLDHGSNGLAQWRLSRLTNYQKFVAAKHPELDQDDFTPEGALWPYFGRLDYQLQFTVEELKTSYTALHAKLVKGGDVASLTADVCWQYERPNKALAHLADRVAYAKAIAAAVAKSSLPTDLPTYLTAVSHEHDQQQNVAAGMMAVPVIATAALTTGEVSTHFHVAWYIWLFVAVCAFVLVAGIIAFVQQHRASANVKAASAAPTPDASPAVNPKRVSVPKTTDEPASSAVTKDMLVKASVAKSAQEEKAALAAAMK